MLYSYGVMRAHPPATPPYLLLRSARREGSWQPPRTLGTYACGAYGLLGGTNSCTPRVAIG